MEIWQSYSTYYIYPPDSGRNHRGRVKTSFLDVFLACKSMSVVGMGLSQVIRAFFCILELGKDLQQ
jgi:hypothetical protein